MREVEQQPTGPPVRQELVDAVTRALVPRYMADQPGIVQQLEETPLALVWQKTGIMEVRQNAVMRVATPVAAGASPLPEVIRAGVEFKLPPVPFAVLQQVVTFFRAVETAHKSEAFAQIAYDVSEGHYYVSVPPQSVSGAHVEHRGPIIPEDHLLLSDVHSHSTMGAFWSGTDDKDEQAHPLRLFGVIGKITQPVPEMRWRVWSGTKFHDLTVGEIFDLSLPMTCKMTAGQILTGTGIDPFGCEIPEGWMAQVSERRYTTITVGDWREEGWMQGWRQYGDLSGMTDEEFRNLRMPPRDSKGFIVRQAVRKYRAKKGKKGKQQAFEAFEDERSSLFPTGPREGQRTYRNGTWWQYVAGAWRRDEERGVD